MFSLFTLVVVLAVVLIIAWGITACVLLLNEHQLSGITLLAIGVYIIYSIGKNSYTAFLSNWHSLWIWVLTHGHLLIGCALGYVVVGVIWSVIKWWLFLIDRKKQLLDGKTLEEYIAGRISSSITDPPKARNTVIHYLQTYLPKVSNHTETIVCWTMFWPFSVVESLFSDILIRFYHRICKELTKVYEAVTNAVFSDILKLKQEENDNASN